MYPIAEERVRGASEALPPDLCPEVRAKKKPPPGYHIPDELDWIHQVGVCMVYRDPRTYSALLLAINLEP